MATGTDGSGPQNGQPPTGATAQDLTAASSGNVPSGYSSATATTTAGYGPGQAAQDSPRSPAPAARVRRCCI